MRKKDKGREYMILAKNVTPGSAKRQKSNKIPCYDVHLILKKRKIVIKDKVITIVLVWKVGRRKKIVFV